MKPRVLVIAGPTGVGKSEAAVLAAEELNGEVISADSRQVYRGLEIGTAAPDRELLQRIPHHLVGIRDPRQSWSAGEFAAEAARCIEAISARSRVPVVTGGSGFYIRALTDGLFEEPPVDPDERKRIRSTLEAQLRDAGVEALWAELAAVDPGWAERIPPTDTQRVIRGLEIHRLHGVPLSELQQRRGSGPPCDAEWRQVLLERARNLLYERLDARVTALFEKGWLEEAERLRTSGIPVTAPGLTGLGYDLLYRLLEGRISREETIEAIRQEHRNYAKRQLTWFRNLDAHRVELGPEDGPEQTAAKILTFWRG
jgi:tRNA dimethylallyltransferase